MKRNKMNIMKNQIVLTAAILLLSITSYANTGIILPRSTKMIVSNTPATEEPFAVIEQPAQFPGGDAALQKYIQHSISYPVIAKTQGITGKVIVAFEVDEAGTLSNIEVVQGIGGGCEEEVVKVLTNMPHWTPGNQAGHSVKTKKLFSINFQL
jgi:TonB family protein